MVVSNGAIIMVDHNGRPEKGFDLRGLSQSKNHITAVDSIFSKISIRVDFIGFDNKNPPLGKMQSKSENGLALLWQN
jgi:hypothetical protein